MWLILERFMSSIVSSGAEDHHRGVHTAGSDFYWMWSFLLCLDSRLHFVLGSSVRKAWILVPFLVFST